MIDKLKLTTDIAMVQSNLDRRYDLYTRQQGQLDKYYSKCTVYYKGNDHLITLKEYPKNRIASQAVIEINPSKFNSNIEMESLISLVAPIESFTIRRIDHAVDLNMSIDEVFLMIKVKGKKKRTDYEEKSKITGFEIGRGNEIICVYDKNFERVTKRKFRKCSSEYTNKTRVEVRHHKTKIIHKPLVNLYLYAETNPFSCLEFYHLQSTDKISQKNLTKYKLLKEWRDNFGMQGTYKELNKNNNFNKTFGNYLNLSNISQKMAIEHRDWIQQFMER